MPRSYASGLTIAADSFVDLQTHTDWSDGKWSPDVLLNYFVSQGFATAAITDHDRVDTMDMIQESARQHGFPLLVAVEMTTQWQQQIVDLLCFGFENNPAPLLTLSTRIHQAQSDVSKQVYHYLVHNGYLPYHDEAVLDAIVQATPSKQPHLLFDLFIQNNPTLQDDFSAMKAAGYKLCTNPTESVVEATHESGGVALIAHPGRTDGFATFDADLLDQFRRQIPIDGIEVYYPRHTPQQTHLYHSYAQRHGWLISAGSDSHTSEKPPIKYRASQCIALLERLDITVS